MALEMSEKIAINFYYSLFVIWGAKVDFSICWAALAGKYADIWILSNIGISKFAIVSSGEVYN